MLLTSAIDGNGAGVDVKGCNVGRSPDKNVCNLGVIGDG